MTGHARTLDFKHRFTFSLGLGFELFHALQVLADPNARVHPEWKERTLRALGNEFVNDLGRIGLSPVIWSSIADLLRLEPVDLPFDSIIRKIEQTKIRSFQREVLEGILHDRGLSDALIDGKTSLAKAMGQVPKIKREWLAFVGLYPFQPGSPVAAGLTALLDHPTQYRERVLRILGSFWSRSFRETWNWLQPQLRRSLGEKQRLLGACSFSEFARLALLRIEVDEKGGRIRAARGGDEYSFDEIERGYFMPSAFNDKRYWTAHTADSRKAILYFSYFDPSIVLDFAPRANREGLEEPELDLAMIFKALGDSSRFAIATLIARGPRSSVELAKLLSVSKPAISHHVHVLRDAGLLREVHLSGSILLSLRREIFENLTQLSIQKFFEESAPAPEQGARQAKGRRP
jgi:ArsR family transcriptional regulator, arsenate/arsenite/antimonite-responsive transcriptional repressor